MANFYYATKGTIEPDGIRHLSIAEVPDMMENPWKYYVPPFRIAPHVWFVAGIHDISSYIVDTGDGLILIDCPSVHTVYLQLESIRNAGYDPHNIKHIFITHAHGDHYGGVRPIQEYTGAKVWMSREDDEDFAARLAAGTVKANDLFGPPNFIVTDHYDYSKPFKIGNMSIEIKLVPGHTIGSVAYFFDDTDEETGKTYKVGMHGGMGIDSMRSDRLKAMGFGIELRERYISDCTILSKRKVDICLTSHENHTNLFSGINKEDRSDYSAFVDPSVWENFMINRAEAAKLLP